MRGRFSFPSLAINLFSPFAHFPSHYTSRELLSHSKTFQFSFGILFPALPPLAKDTLLGRLYGDARVFS